MAVLLAVRGGGPYYRLQPGKNTVDERSGKNTWEDMPCESSACRSRARMQAELARGRGRGHFQVTADAHRARRTRPFRCKESSSAPLFRCVPRAAFAQLALAYPTCVITHTHRHGWTKRTTAPLRARSTSFSCACRSRHRRPPRRRHGRPRNHRNARRPTRLHRRHGCSHQDRPFRSCTQLMAH